MSAKVQCHQVVFPALGTHPAIQKCRKTLNGSDPFEFVECRILLGIHVALPGSVVAVDA
jgi:hypothetical protein